LNRNIQCAELADDSIEQLVDFAFVRNVANRGDGATAGTVNLFGNRMHCVFVRRDGNICSLSGKSERQPFADSAAPTGYQHTFVFESFHFCSLS
jgi:hypothetical protein